MVIWCQLLFHSLNQCWPLDYWCNQLLITYCINHDSLYASYKKITMILQLLTYFPFSCLSFVLVCGSLKLCDVQQYSSGTVQSRHTRSTDLVWWYKRILLIILSWIEKIVYSHTSKLLRFNTQMKTKLFDGWKTDRKMESPIGTIYSAWCEAHGLSVIRECPNPLLLF